jgi:hypothetical protein
VNLATISFWRRLFDWPAVVSEAAVEANAKARQSAQDLADARLALEAEQQAHDAIKDRLQAAQRELHASKVGTRTLLRFIHLSNGLGQPNPADIIRQIVAPK